MSEWLYDAGLSYEFRDTDERLLIGGSQTTGVRASTDDGSFDGVDQWDQVDAHETTPVWRQLPDLGFRCARTLAVTAVPPPYELPPPVAPGSADEVSTPDCSVALTCGGTIEQPWSSLQEIESRPEMLSLVPDAIRSTVISFIESRIGLRPEGSPLIYQRREQRVILGFAAGSDNCPLLAWFADALPLNLAPDPALPECERCWVGPAQGALQLRVPELSDPVPLRGVWLQMPAVGEERGRLRAVLYYEELKDIRILNFGGIPVSSLITPEHADLPDGGFQFDVTFAERTAAAEGPVYECEGI